MCPLYISMHLISNKLRCIGLSFLSYFWSSHLFKQCIALPKKSKTALSLCFEWNIGYTRKNIFWSLRFFFAIFLWLKYIIGKHSQLGYWRNNIFSWYLTSWTNCIFVNTDGFICFIIIYGLIIKLHTFLPWTCPYFLVFFFFDK